MIHFFNFLIYLSTLNFITLVVSDAKKLKYTDHIEENNLKPFSVKLIVKYNVFSVSCSKSSKYNKLLLYFKSYITLILFLSVIRPLLQLLCLC